ncbi:hypothetical protein BGZ74_007653 [Mortierella antarctica]|nr:hypothetical protein BGZ74_007653 [Mortierella antarctica]
MGTPIENPDAAREQLKEPAMEITIGILDYLKADYSQKYLRQFKDKPISSPHGNHYFLSSALSDLYYEYYDAMMEKCATLYKCDILHLVKLYKPKDPPGMVPSVIAKSIIRGHYLDDWLEISNKYVQTFQELFEMALSSLIMSMADPPARELFVSIFGQFYTQKVEQIKATIEQIFKDESDPLILSDRYSENLEKNRIRINHASIFHDRPIKEKNKGSVKTPPPLPYGTPECSQTGSPEPQHRSQNSREISDPSQNSGTGAPDRLLSGSISPDPSQRIQRAQEYSWGDEHAALELALTSASVLSLPS